MTKPLTCGHSAEKPNIGMTAPIDRSRTFIGPVIAGIILVVLFGGYVLFAWLAGDV